MKHLLVTMSILTILSCTKECPDINPYFAEVYPQILDSIDIECVESNEDFFIAAIINEEEFCHDQEKVGIFRLAVSNKFTTSSPSIDISTGEISDNARKGLSLQLGTSEHFNEHFTIQFPDFDLERSGIDHLDSILAKENHDVIGNEDINIPEGLSFEEKGLLEANGGYLTKFLITLNSLDEVSDTGGINFRISSIFGDQDGSFLRFNEFKKTEESDGIYYYLDIEFKCNLYHWHQYGYEGLWGKLRDGKIIAKVKLEQ